ncbi:MAG: hypothetical protein ACYDAP_06590 [Thermoplasmataceae archaeon]
MMTNLSDIFRLHEKFNHISFSEVIKASSGYDIIPIDLNNSGDVKLIDELSMALQGFTKYAKSSGARFQGNRINDVGKNFENAVQQAIDRTSITINKLTKMGYPDFRLTQENNRVSYLEIKVSGLNQNSRSSLRSFFYSSAAKIDCNARHLLLKVYMNEETSKYWKIASWELKDLSTLDVSLKTEFNAGSSELGDTKTLAHS